MRFVAPALVATLVGATLSVTAAPAAAEPSWTAPDRVSKGENIRGVLTDGAGRIQGSFYDGWHGGGMFQRDPSGNWSRLTNGDGFAADEVVMDSAGNQFGASADDGSCWWSPADDLAPPADTDFSVVVAYRPVGGSWRTETLPGSWDSCSSGRAEVAVDDAGTATVVWQGDGELHTSHRPPGGRWSDPRSLGEVTRDYDVATDGSGRVAAVWEATEGHLLSAVRSSAGRWSPARTLDADVSGTISSLRLVGGSPEPLVATWIVHGADRTERLRAAFRGRDGRWRVPRTVATAPRYRLHSVTSTVHATVANVAWFQGNAAGGSVRVSAGTLRGWSDPVVLGARLPRLTTPSTAANELGTLVAWTAGDADHSWTMAALRRPGESRWRRSRHGTPDLVDQEGRPSWDGLDGAPQAVAYRPDQLTLLYSRPGTMFRDFVDDTTPPRARVVRPRGHFLGGPWMPVRWAAADDLTGARNYDVRVRSADRDGELSRWSVWQKRTRAVRANHRVEPQRTYCFSARARDRAGNRGRWSAPRCVAVPIDDRAFRASTGWTRVDGANAYRQTLTRTRQHGARLTVRGVGARSLSLLARTCPSCGVVRVSHAGRDLGRVDLSAPTTVMPRVIRLGGHGGRLTGRVVVRVVSRGKPVHVDGVIAQR